MYPIDFKVVKIKETQLLQLATT